MTLATLALCAVTLLAPPQERVESERLLATIRELPAKRAAMGDEAHRAGLVETEELLLRRLKELGYTPWVQEFKWAVPARNFGGEPGAPPIEPHPWRNIFVDLPGTDLAGEVLLISAHFDAVPGSPGADDDGTGTAAILELARVLKDQPTRRTIRLALFNLEECGLIGSTRYVMSLNRDDAPNAPGGPVEVAKKKESIIGMVSLEMLGYFTDAPGSQRSPIKKIEGVFDPPTVGDGIAIVGVAKHRDFSGRFADEMVKACPTLKVVRADFLPAPVPDMMRSDHRPFVLAGIAGVMLTDTADFRNPNYHKATDTVETLDPVRFTLVVKAVAAAVTAIAEPAVAADAGK